MKKIILGFSFLAIFVSPAIALDFSGDLMSDPQNTVKIAFDKAVAAGEDLRESKFSGSVCHHVIFDHVDVSNSTFAYTYVMRFCNFKHSIADNSVFEGFLYSQTFDNTSLKNATFINSTSTRSNIIFRNCDLGGARFVNYDMKDIRFENSNVLGALINGAECLTSSIEDCIASN